MVHNSQNMEWTEVSIIRWIDKKTAYYSDIQKNEMLPFILKWIPLNTSCLVKSANTQMQPFIPYMWELKFLKIKKLKNKERKKCVPVSLQVYLCWISCYVFVKPMVKNIKLLVFKKIYLFERNIYIDREKWEKSLIC